jgi:hypothetical protein
MGVYIAADCKPGRCGSRNFEFYGLSAIFGQYRPKKMA